MKECPSCGENTMVHKRGMWACVNCNFQHDSVRRKSRTKRCLERIDRIGARLANVRW
jgi:ribosomal protein L37AE/L43A